MSGAVSYHAGLQAEDCVARHYREAGHEVVAQRWRGAGGEIDLILRDGAGLIFVEVKKARDFLRAAESLGAPQMRRIYQAAAEFLGTMPMGELTDARFDVALVNGTGEIEIIENALGH